jgi:pyruvate/2-oxoglutarate dehydrogenase complex dihydrolipoamide acyltransferase (E2) component
MKMKVKVPKIGLTTEQVTLSQWSKELGANVEAGEVIAVVEADKTAVDIVAPMAGKLIEQLAALNAELNIGDALAVIETA